MKHSLMSALAAAAVLMSPAAARADCTLYQHRDYGGSHWSLSHFERMVMTNGESLGCTTNGHGGGCESTTYEPSWNDQVSSFRVSQGCTLSLWVDVNEGGARFRSDTSYKYVGSRWNDKASEALCMCNG